VHPLVEEIASLAGVTKRYGDRTALRSVGFTIRTGEAVGYLGPNGAGKTTTLRLLAGLSRPDEGTVRVRGKDPVADHAEALAHVGVVVETPGVPPYVRGRDLLTQLAEVKRVPLPERAANVQDAARSLGVADHLDRPMGSLSTGLARRVLLSGALIGEPELLLLDEPTLGLDPAARDDLRGTLRALRTGGRAILLSTHLLDDVAEVCDRVLFLREGRIVGDEPVRIAPTDSNGAPLRAMRIRFAEDVPPARLASLEEAVARLEIAGARDVMVYFSGGEARQSDLIALIVRSGLPLVSAGEPSPELGRRYLERVGREEAT